jgi:hypothetical protein
VALNIGAIILFRIKRTVVKLVSGHLTVDKTEEDYVEQQIPFDLLQPIQKCTIFKQLTG